MLSGEEEDREQQKFLTRKTLKAYRGAQTVNVMFIRQGDDQ